MPTLDESRELILDEIGFAPEMSLIRPYGNLGDELIWAGTRELLSGHVYREIDIEELSSARGELAVIAGGGAWSRRYSEFMPEVLAIAEMRFERVIILPSTFEVAEDRVRDALSRSDATVFAREFESFGQIQGICRAKLAHDLAFFADLSGYDAPGEGELNAFRTDGERSGGFALPQDNVDISAEADSLEDWLHEIERHAVVNTDRAHVMIAAARMGKSVNYASSSYFKVGAIAQSSLADLAVHPIETATRAVDSVHEKLPTPSSARVTIAVLSRDHGETVTAAIDSALAVNVDAHVLVLDRNSRPRTRAVLERTARQSSSVEFKLANRDVGLAASQRLASELAETEFLFLLGDDMVLQPGAIELLVDELENDFAASAVSANITDDYGTTLSCGGWPRQSPNTVAYDTVTEASSGPTGWMPLLGTLFRRSVLEMVPLAPGMSARAQSIDWALRVERDLPGSLRTRADAVVTAAAPVPPVVSVRFAERAQHAQSLVSHAHFYERHGLILTEEIGELVPELRDADGGVKVDAARYLLELVAARGPEWVLMEWMNGGLIPLLGWRMPGDGAELSDEQRGYIAWLEQRNESLVGIENGGWWKLRGRLQPLIRLFR